MSHLCMQHLLCCFQSLKTRIWVYFCMWFSLFYLMHSFSLRLLPAFFFCAFLNNWVVLIGWFDLCISFTLCFCLWALMSVNKTSHMTCWSRHYRLFVMHLMLSAHCCYNLIKSALFEDFKADPSSRIRQWSNEHILLIIMTTEMV